MACFNVLSRLGLELSDVKRAKFQCLVTFELGRCLGAWRLECYLLNPGPVPRLCSHALPDGAYVIICVQHSAWIEEVRLFRGRGGGEEVSTSKHFLSQPRTNVGQLP